MIYVLQPTYLIHTISKYQGRINVLKKRINGGMKRENKEKLILPEATENKMLQMSVHEASFDL